MADTKVECRKIRGFSENFNDTFEFIRQNAKPLLWAYLGIAGVFVLVQAVLQGILETDYLEIFRLIRSGSLSPDNLPRGSRFAGNWTLPVLFFTWLAVISMQVCIGSYMKYYLENGRQAPTVDQVWAIFRRYFFRVMLGSVVTTLLTITGTFLCLLPGIFLAVVLIPFPWVQIIEDASIGGAFNRCFELIKGYFWESFVIYLVTYLLYRVAHSLFDLLGLLASFLSMSLGYGSSHGMQVAVSAVATVARAFGFVFFVIFLISTILHYFNLVERRDATGMMARVQRIGEQPGAETDTSETY